MAFLSADYFAGGKVPDRSGNNHAIVAPYGLFKAKDGAIAVAPSNDTYVERSWMLSALGIYWTTTDFAPMRIVCAIDRHCWKLSMRRPNRNPWIIGSK